MGNSIETSKHWKNMIKTKKNIECSIVCGPLTKFLLMDLILRPALQFEFDMPALEVKAKGERKILFFTFLYILHITYYIK